MRWQSPNGLSGCYIDQPEAVADTSRSAGLAAALAVGARRGWLPPEALAAARRTRDGLAPHITLDGLLGGVAQSNRGGDSLQRGPYRVLFQMGMGLVAQLLANL